MQSFDQNCANHTFPLLGSYKVMSFYGACVDLIEVPIMNVF